MAGDWIKMRTDLDEDPAVISIAASVGIDADHVVGKLWKLWSWASRQTTDGNAARVTGKWIDRFVGCEGFASAMRDAGWLDLRADGLTFPNFDRHNSETAKQRALATIRVARHRGAECNDARVTKPLPEKRREESSSAKRGEADSDRNELLDALAEVTGIDRQTSGAHIGRVAKALRKADPPYTPAEVRSLTAILGARQFTLPLTPGTVEKYIGWARKTPTPDVARKAAEEDRASRMAEQRERSARERAESIGPVKLGGKNAGE